MASKVCVVGAGVVGLSTATHLQEQCPDAHITIIADKFTVDTTSDGAAGIFRPGSSFRCATSEITRQCLDDSFYHYRKFLDDEAEAIRAGIKWISGYQLSSKYPGIVRNAYLESVLDEFRPCTKEELEIYPGDWKYGSFYKTILIENRRYLPYLTEKFKSRGGVIEQHCLESLDELGKDFDVICNCSGFGARELCNDITVLPMRGQVFKVNAPWVKNFLYVDYDTYILPGFSSITLGGCRQYDSWNAEVNKYDSAAIWERCTSILPSLEKAEIVKEWVGWRPYRYCVRIEKENFPTKNGNTLKVVHNYGHGGYGVLSAPGTAKYAVNLIQDFLPTTSVPLSKL
ncbi:D-amino acid oxidase 1 [Oratosquilla oratoria]|uniref:D-amino acid oxidase 1 n=1 Tax=Oratosquilla oratoria TaxID=337810 RepID=UPI003F76CB30